MTAISARKSTLITIENRGQAMLYAISGKTGPLSFPRDVT